MIRATVFYPYTPGARFDHHYYASQHCPMVEAALRPFGCLRVEVDRGLEGGDPGSPPPFVAVAHIVMVSREGLKQGFSAHGQAFLDDVPNYTSIVPGLQINEMVSSPGGG